MRTGFGCLQQSRQFYTIGAWKLQLGSPAHGFLQNLCLLCESVAFNYTADVISYRSAGWFPGNPRRKAINGNNGFGMI